MALVRVEMCDFEFILWVSMRQEIPLVFIPMGASLDKELLLPLIGTDSQTRVYKNVQKGLVIVQVILQCQDNCLQLVGNAEPWMLSLIRDVPLGGWTVAAL